MSSTQIIITTGPESSGKSTLASQLSDSLRAPLVTEFSREYLLAQKERDAQFQYQQEDLLTIAREQEQLEQRLLPFEPEQLICDTDLLVIMIWSEVKYGTCDSRITDKFEQSFATSNRLYLLCDWNIPWQDDPLREHPHSREFLFSLYKNKLEHYQLPYFVVSGTVQNRLNQALQFTQ